MSTTLIHQGPAYELSVSIEAGPYGHYLKFVSFVPIARNPEHQVRFQAHLSEGELEVLHKAIGQALRRAVRVTGRATGRTEAVRASRSLPEPAASHAGSQADTTHPQGVAAAIGPAGEPT
jgi:hypothetical protein